MKNKQFDPIVLERWDIAEILAENFVVNDKKYDDSDFEWAACQLQMAGYHKQKWISVEDRLPKNDYEKHWKERQQYLVVTAPSNQMCVATYGYKDFGWWVDGHHTVLDEKNYRKVSHWMPLPEAPKGEQQ